MTMQQYNNPPVEKINVHNYVEKNEGVTSFFHSLLFKYFSWILKRKGVVIIACFAITLLALLQMGNIRLVVDMNSTLPQSHPYISANNEIYKVFGLKNLVVIGVSSKNGDIYQEKIINKIQRITSAVAKIPGVNKDNIYSPTSRKSKVISSVDNSIEVRSIFKSSGQSVEKIEDLKKEVAKNPVLTDSIISSNSKTAAIVVQFQDPETGFRTIMDQVKSIVATEIDAETEIIVGGEPSYLAQTEHYSERMGVLLPLAIAILCLVLYGAFRTKQGAALPLITAIMSMIWAVGLMSFLNIPFDVFNATTPILILAIATGHAVQMLKRYYEEYNILSKNSTLSAEQINRQALMNALMRVGPVMIVAGLVTAISFFSLLVFEISTIRTFGFFSGVGIVSVMVLEMSFIPAVRAFFTPKVSQFSANNSNGLSAKVVNKVHELIAGERRGLVFVAFLVLAATSIFGISRLVEENSVKSFFAESSQVAIDDSLFNSRMAGSNTLYIEVDGGTLDSIKKPSTLKSMQQLQEFLKNKNTVGKTTSLADFVMRMNQAMHGDDPKYASIPDDAQLVSQYLTLYSLSGDPGDFSSFVNDDYEKANIIVNLKSDSSIGGERLVEEIKKFAVQNFAEDVKLRFGGSVLQSAALSDVMVKGKILNILQIMLVIFTISCIAFRSVFAGILVSIPIVFSVLVTFGAMGIFGIPLNVPTSLTAALAAGIGSDFSIYLIFRLREELRKKVEMHLAVKNILNSAGKAILFVAMSVALGYGVLMLSFGFRVHQWLGLLIATGMVFCALTAVVLVPAIILSLRPKFIFK